MIDNVNAGEGSYQTISTRGVGFAPEKQTTLVEPPGEQELPEVCSETPQRVGRAAMKIAAKINAIKK